MPGASAPATAKGLMLGALAFLIYKMLTRTTTERDKLQAFVMSIWDDAQAVARENGWTRDLIITQAALESGAWRPKTQTSKLTSLAATYKNLYGMKTGKAWEAAGKPKVMLKTEEHVPDPDNPGKFKVIEIQDWFRVYPTWGASIRDWAALLKGLSRYKPVTAALESGDYNGFFQSLKDSGYSTHQQYPQLLAQVYDALEGVIV